MAFRAKVESALVTMMRELKAKLIRSIAGISTTQSGDSNRDGTRDGLGVVRLVVLAEW